MRPEPDAAHPLEQLAHPAHRLARLVDERLDAQQPGTAESASAFDHLIRQSAPEVQADAAAA